jgi:hypothetical protein
MASMETESRVFSFVTPERVRVSWSYTTSLAQPTAAVKAIDSALRLGNGRAPDDVIVGAGIYDYRDKKWSDENNTFITDQLDHDKNFEVAEKRRAGSVGLMHHVANVTGGLSRFWYRNNHCNSRFPAAHSDVRVEPSVKRYGGRVLDTFNFSVMHWSSMALDNFHSDMEPCIPASRWDPPSHVGELVSQAAQSMLNQLCFL